MKNDELMEKLLDDVIKEAAIQVAEELGEEYAELENDIDFDVPESHDAKIAEIIKTERKKSFRIKLLKNSRRIAIILIGFIIVASSITIFSVEALRIRFLNMFIDTKQTHSKINFNENRKGDSFSTDDIYLGYIPEGFELKNNKSENENIVLKFTKDDEFFEIHLLKYKNDSNNGINTENVGVVVIEINGHEGAYIVKDGTNILTWHDDNYIYKLVGNMGQNELLKIAENVKK